MTSRERFLATFRGTPLDRFFRYEHGPWPTTFQRWLTEGFPRDSGLDQYFQMDPLVRIRINSGYCDSPYHPKFTEETLEETAHYRLYTDGDGITKKVFKNRADTSMPQFLKFPVANRADWKTLLSRLNPQDAAGRIGDTRVLIAQCANPEVPTMLPICGAFGHPRNLLGDEGLAYLFYDDPLLLEEILDNWLDLYAALLRELTRHIRLDALLIWEDMCYRGGPLISPEQFRRYMLPRYRRLIQTGRSCGVQAVIVDTDGDCHSMIPVFLEAGADGLMPFEVQAGMDVVRVHRSFPTLAIMGGIDKRALARDRKDIRAEVDRVLPHFAHQGHYIPTLDHTVPPDVPLKNFEYYLECVRSYEKINR